MRWKDC